MRIMSFRKSPFIILFMAVLLFAMPAASLATDYYVKTAANGGNDSNNGTSWATAKATITGAMDLADGSDNIYVAAGTYSGTVNFPSASSIQLLGGYPAAGGGTQDPWNNVTIISGGGPVVSIPFDSSGGGQRSYFGLVIDGFTIKDGSASNGYAAGIRSYSAGLTIKRCIIEANSGTGTAYAGGIGVLSMIGDSSAVIFKLEESIIRNNTGLLVGGLYFDSIGYPQFQVTNCLIHGNSATGNSTSGSFSVGGVIIGTGAQTIGTSSIINSTIADNSSVHNILPVGGIAVNTDPYTNPVNIKNCIIWHSSLDDVHAQEDYWGDPSPLSISYSNIHDSGDSGTGVIHTNPAFAGASDYHLTSGSGGCINGGTASGAPSADLEGTTRDGNPDMGAYEYSAPAGPDITVTDNKGTTDDLQVPFGEVTEGDSADAIVTITNDGTQNLDIGTITDPAAPFSIAETCSGQLLAPAASCDITVTFAPTGTGAFNGSFSIPSDDPDENPVTVQLSGTGTAVPQPDITVTDNKGTVDDQEVPFGNLTVGESADATVTITNNGNADLNIGTITDPASPFSIAETCSGQALAPAASCDVTVTFAPAAAGAFSDTFSIPSDDPDENPVTVNVSGNGVSPVTQYTLTTAVDPADSGTVTLDPAGGTYDEGTSVSLTATPNSNYIFDGWDGEVGDSDSETTTTTMNADKTITAMFMADNDNDGVSTEEEQGPDGTDATYDGDSSGTADSLEDNVASGHTFDGVYYVTLAAPATQSLANVETNDNPSSSDSPSGASFPYGFFDFTVAGVTPGDPTTVTIYLPAGEEPTTYWKYGPTPTDGTDHWYEFLYDGTTGAEFNNNVITLHFVDGQRGDDDLAANGVVSDIGAPAKPAAAGSSGGSSGGCFISVLSR